MNDDPTARARARYDLGLAAGLAIVVSVVVGCSPAGSDSKSLPKQTSGRPSTSEATKRPDPTYKPSPFPSGLVARLPDRDVVLPADTSCWTTPTNCRRALLSFGGSVPDLGQQDSIDFWFARPGWRFGATLRRSGDECPRVTTVEVTRTKRQWFRVPVADTTGRYVVDLYGQGPQGAVSTRFLWTTTSDGPVDPPQGSLLLAPESRGEGSFGLEVRLEDLPFQPARSEVSDSVKVVVTDAHDRERVLVAPLIRQSMNCIARGSFYYQAEWDEAIEVLGESPFDLAVTLTVRDTTYVGRATWDGSPRPRTGYVPVTFTPRLPSDQPK